MFRSTEVSTNAVSEGRSNIPDCEKVGRIVGGLSHMVKYVPSSGQISCAVNAVPGGRLCSVISAAVPRSRRGQRA